MMAGGSASSISWLPCLRCWLIPLGSGSRPTPTLCQGDGKGFPPHQLGGGHSSTSEAIWVARGLQKGVKECGSPKERGVLLLKDGDI